MSRATGPISVPSPPTPKPPGALISQTPEPGPAEPQWWPFSARLALVAIVVGSLVLRLAWVALMPPSKDEAYHYLYSVYPTWSYFDHPPMMMLVVRLGLELCGGCVSFFSLRLGFVLLIAATSWVLGRWTARRFGEWAGVYAALWCNLAPFFSLGAGGQAMPDGPFYFFAVLTMLALTRALVDAPGQTLPWVWVGLAWACALLSKYHAVFLPAGAVVYVLLTPDTRRVLLTPGPYLAVLIGFLGFTPVLYWNATHDWASFAFQSGRAVGTEFRPDHAGRLLLREMAYLTPALWVAVLVVIIGGVRYWRTLGREERLLLCLGVFTLAFFLSVSFLRRVSPHWPLIGVLLLLPLVGKRCVEWYRRWPRTTRIVTTAWTVGFVALAFVFAIHARTGVLSDVVPLKDDPAREQCGWESIADRLDAHGLVGKPNTFIFCNEFHEAGQLGFAVANRSPVLCYSHFDTRGFAYWSRPEDWLGQDGVLVALDNLPWEPLGYAPFFARIELVDEFWMTRNGQPIRPVRIFYCTNQIRPFPFTNPAAARQ